MSPSPSSSPSPPSTRSSSPAYTPSDGIQTIHHRRTMLRAKSDDERTPPPPALHGFADFFHARTAAPFSVPAATATQRESDAECWVRMLALQREYHCYKSARLEAAVEALESGYSIEDVPMRECFFPPLFRVMHAADKFMTASRLCLDLLNEELKAQIEAHQVGLVP